MQQRRTLTTTSRFVLVLAGLLGFAPLALAEPGWVGPRYSHGGHDYHHRAWAFDKHHHRYYRYY